MTLWNELKRVQLIETKLQACFYVKYVSAKPIMCPSLIIQWCCRVSRQSLVKVMDQGSTGLKRG